MSLPKPTITQAGHAAIDSFLADVDESKRVPATFLGVATAERELYYNHAGDRVFGEPDKGKVDEDTIVQLFSCSKLVVAVACLQLIEQGKISLHDPELIAKHLPELRELSILEGYDDAGKEILRKAKNKITLNMLLTHTSGFAYEFISPLIARWLKEHNTPMAVSAHPPISAFCPPLLFEPGTHFSYSFGYDWAGFLVSRITGLTLEEYFQKHIFQPCGIKNMSFFPPADYAKRGMGMFFRSEAEREMMREGTHFLASRALAPADIGPNLSGGAGLFGTARDYLRLLRALLASADPATPNPLISAASFKTLFTDAIPLEHQADCRADLAAIAQWQEDYDPAWSASGKGESLGHSIGLFLTFTDSKHGRSAGSGSWFGFAKTMFWLDPAKGIAGVCFTQLMPDFGKPETWNKVYNEFEKLVYDNLEDA